MCIRNPQAVLGPTLEKMRHSAACRARTSGVFTGSAACGAFGRADERALPSNSGSEVGHGRRDGLVLLN